MKHLLAVMAVLFAAPAVGDEVEKPSRSLPYSPAFDPASMDGKVDPCTDFYRYACGGWLKANPIPADQASWSVYGKLQQDNLGFLWGLLDDLSHPAATRTPVQQKLGDFFGACMDEATIEKQGAAPLKPWLEAIAKLDSVKNLAPLLARLQLATLNFYYGGFLFGFGSQQSYADSTQVIADAAAGGLGLPNRDYYTRTDPKSQGLREKYVAHIQAMLQLLGDAPAAAAREATTVLAIEDGLARATLTPVQQRDPHNLSHLMTRAELAALVPAFDWTAFFGEMGLAGVDAQGGKLNVDEPAFEAQLQASLASVPLADWKTYLRWHLVHAMAPYLSTPFVNADFELFRHALHGVPALKPRWKRCVGAVDHALPQALGEEFVRRTFTPDTKHRATDMVRRIEDAMEVELRGLDWMGPETRGQALAKLHAMVNKVGMPDHSRDYGPLEVRPGDFAGNVARSQTFESQRWMAKIGKPVDRDEWVISPPSVNAYYDPQLNAITLTAGVLQPPLFDVKADDAPNYGNTGSCMGHELTHGFDDEGRQFDARGDLRDWWTPKDAEAFKQRAACVVDQYGKYTVVDDLKLNSQLTEGEDVADLGGTQLAYLAWKQAEAAKKLESIGGFTPDQRFFIGFAQWACENQRPENLRAQTLGDPHSPGSYRVNGVVANLPEFQKAFACKAGSPMVNPKPCKVW